MEIKSVNLAICSTGELYGGVEQFIYTFSDYLKKETNINFMVLLFNKGLLYDKLKEAKIETNIIPSGFKYNIGVLKQIIKIFKEKKINVVHTHGYKANILCSIAGKVCNARIIKTEHGKQEPSKGLGFIKMSLNLYLDRFFTKYLVNGLVFVSRDIQNFFHKTYSKSKQWVIYNGISPIEVVGNKDTGIDSRYFNIGIIGRISEVKGHIYLLMAIKRLEHIENIRLYIFGEGPLRKVCEDYSNANGLSNKVYFMGFKTNIYDYMNKLELLVMPSLYEGLPYTVLEAMNMKVPIIASEVGGLKEVINNNYDGILVPIGNELAIANAIEQIYNDQRLRNTFAQNAYKKICSKFSASYMGERYIDLYSELFYKGLKSPKNWGKI